MPDTRAASSPAAGAFGAAAPPHSVAPKTPVEDVLLAYVDQLAGGRAGHRAICFHLSRLNRAHRRETHLQIAANLLKGAVDQFSGHVFVPRSADIVNVWKGITARAIDQTVDALRYLFNDDTLAKLRGEAQFYSAFDLEVGYPQFSEPIREIRDQEAKQLAKANRAPAKPVGRRLNELLDALAGTDLSHMVRRQTVWELLSDKKTSPSSTSSSSRSSG
jgi:hypothetical protein